MSDKSEQQLNEAWVKATQEELRQMRLRQEQNRRACMESIQQEVEQPSPGFSIEYWTDKERVKYIAKLELEIELLKARLDECHRTIAELIGTRKP